MKEHLPLIRESGCRALWLGVEDLTATLVKKGQSADKTTEAFRALRDAGICPMPMMMHHDTQPLYSRGSNYGLLNQIELLRKAGAVSMQVLMLTPAVGSKLLESTYTSGQVFKSVGGKAVRPHMCDGNYVVASNHKRPWQKQLTMLAGYLYFYNPVWLIVALIREQDSRFQEARLHADHRHDGTGDDDRSYLRLGHAPDVRQDRAPLPSARQSDSHAGHRRCAGKP